MLTIYGIRNCNTVKKALSFLENKNIAFTFHDYKKEGISISKLQAWHQQIGFEKLINKKGLTWRKLDNNTQTAANELSFALTLMQDRTSLIKRPIIEKKNQIVAIGFEEKEYEEIFR